MKKVLIAFLFLGLLGLGYWRWSQKNPDTATTSSSAAAAAPAAREPKEPVAGLAATLGEPAVVGPAATYN
jgi:uncharacterized iron-regulated membrane protein